MTVQRPLPIRFVPARLIGRLAAAGLVMASAPSVWAAPPAADSTPASPAAEWTIQIKPQGASEARIVKVAMQAPMPTRPSVPEPQDIPEAPPAAESPDEAGPKRESTEIPAPPAVEKSDDAKEDAASKSDAAKSQAGETDADKKSAGEATVGETPMPTEELVSPAETVDRIEDVEVFTGGSIPEFVPPTRHDAVGGSGITITPAHVASSEHWSKYQAIYDSIPFSRAEYVANPSYRHDATIELLTGQVRLSSGYTGRTLALPRVSQYRPYLPSRQEFATTPFPYFGGAGFSGVGFGGIGNGSYLYNGPAALGLGNAGINTGLNQFAVTGGYGFGSYGFGGRGIGFGGNRFGFGGRRFGLTPLNGGNVRGNGGRPAGPMMPAPMGGGMMNGGMMHGD